MATRKKPAPAPIVLTPEQVAAREDLLRRAQAIAEKLHPGRVYGHSIGECFSVMFGECPELLFTFRGPGLVELQVELSMWERVSESDEFAPASLRFTPRAFSMGSDATMQHCEAVGHALINAAAFARTILALVGVNA